MQSNEDNYRRDSFDDRVCDDLSEVILQYLSIKEKLKLESVSKQFQRTAFLSQLSLQLDRNLRSTERLKHLIQKCPKLNEIIFGELYYGIIISMDLIEVIIKNCNNLRHIHNKYLCIIEKEDEKKFFQKFGHNLISLNIYTYIYWYFIKASNIEELTVSCFDSQLNQIKFNRLKSFCVEILEEEDINSLKIFIENNTKTLKHLDINFQSVYEMTDNSDNEEENVEQRVENFNELLEVITKAKHLIHLKFNSMITQKIFTNYWNRIAINCKQIKSLELYLKLDESHRLNDEIFSTLKQFNRLKRLNLKIIYCGRPPDGPNFKSFEDFKGLEGLTHLSVRDFGVNNSN